MAQFIIDQAGLAAGTLDRSRTDGLSTGALVTLDASAGGGTTFLFELLWVPVGDTTAVSTLTVTVHDAIWTFTPSAGFFGTYRIRLTVDAGGTTESVIIRHFVVRTPLQGLVLPPLNGIADSDASLLNSGSAVIVASEENSLDYTSNTILNNFSYAGWWRALYEVIQAVESGGGGGGGSLQDAYNGGDSIVTGDGGGPVSITTGTVGPAALTLDTAGTGGGPTLIVSNGANTLLQLGAGTGFLLDLTSTGVSGVSFGVTVDGSANILLDASAGTGTASLLAGSGGLFIRDASGVGTSGQVITSNGTLATWEDPNLLVVSNVRIGATYTLTAVDLGTSVRRDSSTANTTTIPTNAAEPLPIGFICLVNQVDSGSSSIIAPGVTLNSTKLTINGQGNALYVHKINTDEWDVIGGIA